MGMLGMMRVDDGMRKKMGMSMMQSQDLDHLARSKISIFSHWDTGAAAMLLGRENKGKIGLRAP